MNKAQPHGHNYVHPRTWRFRCYIFSAVVTQSDKSGLHDSDSGYFTRLCASALSCTRRRGCSSEKKLPHCISATVSIDTFPTVGTKRVGPLAVARGLLKRVVLVRGLGTRAVCVLRIYFSSFVQPLCRSSGLSGRGARPLFERLFFFLCSLVFKALAYITDLVCVFFGDSADFLGVAGGGLRRGVTLCVCG